MNINVTELKKFLKKATLNYSIDSVQMNISKERVVSKMITPSSDAIAILNMDNTILPNISTRDSIVFNFSEPSTTILPYLNLIDESAVTSIDIKEEKIILITGKQRSNIFFCSPQVTSVFEADGPRDDVGYFKTLQLDDDFLEVYNKIKKIGSKFGKVYFGVENRVLYIETSDKTNRFSNGIKIELCDVDYEDMVICLDYKNVVNIMSVMNGEETDFTTRFAYVKDQELGMIYFSNEDNSQKFYLMSKIDR